MKTYRENQNQIHTDLSRTGAVGFLYIVQTLNNGHPLPD